MMKRNIKRKMPIATIVAGILFLGMIGTTVYAVGQMQKMKHSAKLAAVQVVEVEKKAPVQIVEVEKDCPAPDDSLRREYANIVKGFMVVSQTDGDVMVQLAEQTRTIGAEFERLGYHTTAKNAYTAAIEMAKMAEIKYGVVRDLSNLHDRLQ